MNEYFFNLTSARGPKCNVLPACWFPTWVAPLNNARLPLNSIKSISPESGQPPYTENLGIIQRAGQIQSPAGILARISSVPNLNRNESHVSSRTDLVGLMILVGVPCLSHPYHWLSVHSFGGITTRPLVKNASPWRSEVKVGRILQIPLFIKELLRSLSYHWNCKSMVFSKILETNIWFNKPPNFHHLQAYVHVSTSIHPNCWNCPRKSKHQHRSYLEHASQRLSLLYRRLPN